MKKLAFVIGVALLLSCAISVDAGKRRGAEILVMKKDGQQAKGELIAVKAASILLLDSQTGIDDSVRIEDIAIVKVIKESRALAIGVVGFGAGAILGILFGSWLDAMGPGGSRRTSPAA
jgi:hypothetical protein